MAYAALVSLNQTIEKILNEENFHHTSPLENHQIVSLDKYVISLQAFLEDFPKKAEKLEARIRDAAAAAEDIIESMLARLEWSCGPCGFIMFLINELAGKFKYSLRKVAEKMETIVAEVVEIKNSIVIKDEKRGESSIGSSSSTVAPVRKNNIVVGYDDELLEIKDRLAGRSPQLQHLAISGMGGIGKTTLARNAYDDALIQEHFDIRAWVTISQDYRAHEILSRLLDSMKEFNPHESDEMSIEVKIYQILYGRRYLIVMDDIWSTEVLDDVRRLFPDDCNGSRIMLTTRLSDVAAYASSSPYEMRLMDEKKSWDLLKHKIGRALLSDEVEMIGHEIARSCRGLPLAVVVIAGILSGISETPASWKKFAKNIQKATSKDNRMEEIVSLGYNHLPHRLRACLLYMGLLPEDYSIRVSLLIKLWIAEGFLKHPKDSSKSLEADAEEHLEDLVRRNLILVTERKYNGRIKSCSLHDMVRETCISMLKDEKHLRHVTTTNYFQRCTSKRSLLCFSYDDSKCPFFFKRFRLLRVLHIANHPPESPKILKLYRLRYLTLSARRHPLPEDIYKFEDLQSLDLEGYWNSILPSSIWKMRQLRHLRFTGRFPDPVQFFASLENLQTLKRVYDTMYNSSLLVRFPNLKKLGLLFPGDDSGSDNRLSWSLKYLRRLENLKISFMRHPEHFSAVFPVWLKKLTLANCRASVSFLEAIGYLPNLQVLQLIKCIFNNLTWEVRGGEFPQLKMLQLHELEVITSFIVEDAAGSSAFPMLNCLLIHRCYHLVELSDEIGDIPTLELIEVSRSGKGVCEWARRVEEEQQSYGNENLQVRCFHPEPGMLPRRQEFHTS